MGFVGQPTAWLGASLGGSRVGVGCVFALCLMTGSGEIQVSLLLFAAFSIIVSSLLFSSSPADVSLSLLLSSLFSLIWNSFSS